MLEDNFEKKLNKALNMCKHRNVRDTFDKIYPFTTENIAGYLPLFDLKDKSLFTVGSSGDQIFNSILLESKNVTVFDICPFVKEYYYLKKAGIESFSREEFLKFFCYRGSLIDNRKAFDKNLFNSLKNNLKNDDYESFLFWDKLFSEYNGLKIRARLFKDDEYSEASICKINEYLKDDVSYEKLRNNLNKTLVTLKSSNVFVDDIIDNYDNVFLSNLCAYYSSEELVSLFYKFLPLLNDDGKILICYLYYAFDKSGRLARLLQAFNNISENISYNYFDGINSILYGFDSIKDSALVYKKVLKKR